MDRKYTKPGEDTKEVDKHLRNKRRSARLEEVGRDSMEERTNAASWASGSRPSKSYADGSQYMASHDSLSPPYSNTRLTGRLISTFHFSFSPLSASDWLLCFGCLCLRVEYRRLAVWRNASRRLLIYP
ncbi:hypothetical protein CHARACLAT_020893 [Characodon lateralis]|uniref:Uncharacterized protein n=1 Tax=Characodon lateralis TaxID=208331 RepID=A0ABU7DLE1_9TELE|nr:hypothetical protein [Characodon lateralis]